MHPDTLSVILRSASVVALFQAAGMALFLGLCGRLLETSKEPISNIAKASAFASAAQVTAAFSRIAGWLVPGIFVAGFLLGVLLVKHLAEFQLPYGLSLK